MAMTISYVFFLLVVVLLLPTSIKNEQIDPDRPSDNAWCRLGPDHTMCNEYHNGCYKDNINILKIGLDEWDKDEILKKHNEYRTKAANGEITGLPKATQPIPPLEWDEDLAIIAQRWAEQCLMKHDVNRRTEKYPMVGQNVLWIGNSQSFTNHTWPFAIDAWFDELIKFNRSHGRVDAYGISKDGRMNWQDIGSFAQILWHTTEVVGCGKYIIEEEGVRARYQGTFVCNYAPAGNHLGDPIYLTEEGEKNLTKGKEKWELYYD